jgi:hypothetical protein
MSALTNDVCMIGKIMDAALARRLSCLVEAYNVLPNTHTGGRKLRSAEHSLHLIVEDIYKAWNTGRQRFPQTSNFTSRQG